MALGTRPALVWISTYPRKGTETSFHDALTNGYSQISTYPRKGTKTTILINCSICTEISTYPRKGTKTPSCMGKHHNSGRYFNLSPQGDENCLGVVLFAKGGLFQLIPARGRKLIKGHLSLLLLFHFNLSPQGDGNRIDWMRCLLLLTFQLIPARGRKHIAFFETVDSAQQFQLIPARGRKRYERRHVPDRSAFQLIPARGRKPCCSSLLVLLCYCNLSPQGGKKLRIKNGAEFFFCVP